jgi:serine/threonine protein phosphatase PrpC
LGDLRYKTPVNRTENDWPYNEEEVTTSAPPDERGDMVSNHPHLERVELEPGRSYLLALVTDGVSNALEDEEIVKQILEMSASGLDAPSISDRIVEDSTQRQRDNATCMVVFIDA